MNLPQNINWLSILQMVAVVAAVFGVQISQSDVGKLAAAIGTIIAILTPIVTAFVHTFINHPANQAALKATAKEYYTKAKAGVEYLAPVVPLLFFVVMVGTTLSACSTIQGFLGGADKSIGDALNVGSGFQAAYLVTCPQGSTLTFCVTDKAQAKQASQSFTTVSADIVNTYEANGSTSALLAQILVDATDLQTLISNLNSARARAGLRPKIDLVTIITIAETVFTIGSDVYQAIEGAAGGYSNAQLNSLVATINGQNQQIQAL